MNTDSYYVYINCVLLLQV